MENIKNYSSILYNKLKTDELLTHLPVVEPSLISFEAYVAVDNADQYIDYLAGQQSPFGKYIQSTEAGYHNDLRNDGVSEEAEGKYTARMLAEFFRRGVVRTYKYELANQGQEDKEHVFGLLPNDESEKPSFRAVKHFITILADVGPILELGTSNYVLNGSMDDVHQILFQKRDGAFLLNVLARSAELRRQCQH